ANFSFIRPWRQYLRPTTGGVIHAYTFGMDAFTEFDDAFNGAAIDVFETDAIAILNTFYLRITAVKHNFPRIGVVLAQFPQPGIKVGKRAGQKWPLKGNCIEVEIF